MTLRALATALAPHGLILRGGFHPERDDLENTGTVVLIGNAGGAMWAAFAPHVDGLPHSLDRWTKRVIDPIAEQQGARAVYPFGPDAPPFQRWAERSETLYRSPLGILIHPEYGLWHAYRAALLFDERLELPERTAASHPCESCTEKPCLSACPVGAFDAAGYNVSACSAHIASLDRSSDAPNCTTAGCRARGACPVGRPWRYPDEQIRFHMAAFANSVCKPTPASAR